MNKLTTYPQLISALFLCLFCISPSIAQAATESLPENHPIYRQFQTVYERLVPAFGEGRLPPRLVVVPTGVKTREPVASSGGGNEGTLAFEAGSGMMSEGYVAIEERTVTALAELGANRDNAIAFLLSHELAHVYLRHGWVGDFGNSFARTEMGRKMMKAATYEDVVKRVIEGSRLHSSQNGTKYPEWLTTQINRNQVFTKEYEQESPRRDAMQRVGTRIKT